MARRNQGNRNQGNRNQGNRNQGNVNRNAGNRAGGGGNRAGGGGRQQTTGSIQSPQAPSVSTGPIPTFGQRGYVANLPPTAVANYDSRLPAGVAYTDGKAMDQNDADYISDYISGRISDSMSIGNWQSSGGYRGGTTTGAQPGSPSATTAGQKKNYKDVKSIMGGLRIGGDNVLGSREARKISRATGQDYDKVLSKALGSGFSLGAGTVNRSNRAYNSSGYNKFMDMMTGGNALSDIRRIKPSKGQMYSGTYQLDGETMPLVESRRGRANPLSIGGSNRSRKKAAESTTTTGSTSGTSSATQDMGGTGMVGMATAAAKEATENLGPGGLFGGGMGAAGATRLGRAKSRLRQLGIYGRGTNLLSRGLQYGNTLNR